MSASLSPGTLFGGRYRIVRCIAEGGMGAVYEAVHIETEGHHALKIMHAHLFKSEDMRERFRREARVTAKIKSEYIIQVSDAGIDQDTQMPFMIMELLHGEELGDILKKKGRLQPNLALTCLRQVASALDKTYAANIVHRDLKPDNLFLTQREDGSPHIKILDFGIAKIIESSMADKGTQSFGTPVYMAPEQVNSAVPLTGAADIYALGMVTFALLVGVPYWRKELQSADGLIPFLNIVCHGPKISAVQRAAEHGVSLPLGFDAWFAKITAPDPNHRFRLASEAVSALEQALAGWVTLPPQGRPSFASIPAESMSPSGIGSMDAMIAVPREQRPKYRPVVILAILMGMLSGFALGLWFLFRSSPGKATAAEISNSAAPSLQVSAADSSLRPDSQPLAEASASAQAASSVSSAAPTINAAPVKTIKQPSVSKPLPTATTRKPSLYGRE